MGWEGPPLPLPPLTPHAGGNSSRAARRGPRSAAGLPRCRDATGDAGRDLVDQEREALVVPAGVVRVGGDRQEGAEAPALLVELMDPVHALRGIAHDPQVVDQIVDRD